MVASIIARKFGDGSELKLSVRIASPTLKNAIALDISVSQMRWALINETLKAVAKSYKRGGTIMIEDALAAKLWKLVKALELKYESVGLTKESVKDTVTEILYQEVIEERERQAAREAEKKAEAAAEKRMTLKEWIEEFIRQCEDGERLKRRSAKMITPGTIKSYRGTLEQLKEYENKRHKVIDFDDVTLDFYDDWRKFFLSKKDKAGNKRPYSPNTIGRHVKNLKTFLFAAEDMKLTTCKEYQSARFSVDSQEVENVYLTDERVQQLYETDFEDEATVKHLMEIAPSEQERDVMRDQLTRRTPKILNQAKDIFVVGCLTGQRVSDYKRISEDMIRTLDDGNEYIYLKQDKTGKWIYIPMDIRVRAILAKYGGKLPRIYDQDLNERIKVVGRLMGWRENAGITELHGMMEVPTQKSFYECIKTHTARRTFATNAYKQKISLSSIMVITGHSSEKMLRKYLKLDKEESAILAAAEFAKVRKAHLKVAE